MKNYAIEETHRGELWILAGSSPEGREVEIEEGRQTALELDTQIHIAPRVAGSHGLNLGLAIAGDSECGLSIIKKDDRIKFRYCVQNAAGEEMVDGPMTYG